MIWGFPHLCPLRLELQVGSHAYWTIVWVLGIWALVLLLGTKLFNYGAFSLTLDSQIFFDVSYLLLLLYYYYYFHVLLRWCFFEQVKKIQKLNYCLGAGKDWSPNCADLTLGYKNFWSRGEKNTRGHLTRSQGEMMMIIVVVLMMWRKTSPTSRQGWVEKLGGEAWLLHRSVEGHWSLTMMSGTQIFKVQRITSSYLQLIAVSRQILYTIHYYKVKFRVWFPPLPLPVLQIECVHTLELSELLLNC